MVARAFSSATFCHSQRSPAACVSNQGASGFTLQAMALGFSVTFAANPVVAGEERSYHLSWFRGVGPLAASYLCGVVARVSDQAHESPPCLPLTASRGDGCDDCSEPLTRWGSIFLRRPRNLDKQLRALLLSLARSWCRCRCRSSRTPRPTDTLQATNADTVALGLSRPDQADTRSRRTVQRDRPQHSQAHPTLPRPHLV